MITKEKESELTTKLLNHVESECKAVDVESRFADSLDECYSFESIGGPFFYMSPSRVLKKMDPTAFRCGVADFSDGEDWCEVNGDYYERDAVETARDEFTAGMEGELADLESELEETEPETTEAVTLIEQMQTLTEEIAFINNYTF